MGRMPWIFGFTSDRWGTGELGLYTSLKTNMEPENDGFSKRESPLPGVHFQGSMLVFGNVTLLRRVITTSNRFFSTTLHGRMDDFCLFKVVLQGNVVFFQRVFQGEKMIPCRELIYPTWKRGKSSSKVSWSGIW